MIHHTSQAAPCASISRLDDVASITRNTTHHAQSTDQQTGEIPHRSETCTDQHHLHVTRSDETEPRQLRNLISPPNLGIRRNIGIQDQLLGETDAFICTTPPHTSRLSTPLKFRKRMGSQVIQTGTGQPHLLPQDKPNPTKTIVTPRDHQDSHQTRRDRQPITKKSPPNSRFSWGITHREYRHTYREPL